MVNKMRITAKGRRSGDIKRIYDQEWKEGDFIPRKDDTLFIDSGFYKVASVQIRIGDNSKIQGICVFVEWRNDL